jgi:hypothetical protein
MDRNQYLEVDGLYWESETHEWFNDKISTQHAHKKSELWGSGTQDDDLTNLYCFVVRDKKTGEYNRVVVNNLNSEVVYETKSLEELAFWIDKLKVVKRFN